MYIITLFIKLYKKTFIKPRTTLGPVTLTVGVVLGPVWGLLH